MSLDMAFLESYLCAESAKKGQAESESITAPNPPQLIDIRTGSVAFHEPQQSMKRFIFTYPAYIDAIMSLAPNDLKYVWAYFFGSYTKKKKIDYNIFKPSWLDSRTVFVVGKEKTKLFPCGLD